ncbi:MAG: hypothetical protein ACKVQR_23270 [Aquabacterium sp.]
MPSLLRLLATQPALLGEHAQAYGELVVAGLPRAAAAWRRQAMLVAGAVVCLLAAVVLAGVAVMLWATLPAATMPAPWLLLVAPLVPALVGIACMLAAPAPAGTGLLDDLQTQVQADLAMLRDVTT